VQVFLINSILSKYKDVVCMIPAYNMTADQLHKMIFTVLKEVEGIGFQIISIISDNNAINRKAFELFSPSKILCPSVTHPLDENRSLFFIFDTVHIMKCVRNNWLSKQGALKYPDIDDFAKIQESRFENLQTLYKMEETSLIKFGHLLSYKALYPSNIQKQNVKLATYCSVK
jgi:hypothetical protein